MIPRDSYRINESLIFSNNSQFLENRRYKLTIIKRFEFSSKFQSNSVIVKNHLDGSYRFFIKGAPEKIIHICRSESLPENLSEQLLNHTQIGYRVLACASRPIFENYNYESDEGREKFENDLIFLGFVVFRNKLKRDTKQIITKLNSSSINMVIATGDNPFTSISVARECGLIERSKEIFFCDLKKENSEDSLELYDITRGKEYNYVHEVKANNSINYISNLKVTINKGINKII